MPDDDHSAITVSQAKLLFADWKAAPAIVLALTPHLAAWAKLQIDTMLGSTIDAAQQVGGLAADKVGDVKAAAIPHFRSRACSTMGWTSWVAVRSSPASCSARSACS